MKNIIAGIVILVGIMSLTFFKDKPTIENISINKNNTLEVCLNRNLEQNENYLIKAIVKTKDNYEIKNSDFNYIGLSDKIDKDKCYTLKNLSFTNYPKRATKEELAYYKKQVFIMSRVIQNNISSVQVKLFDKNLSGKKELFDNAIVKDI